MGAADIIVFGLINEDLGLRRQTPADLGFVRALFLATRAGDFAGTGLPPAAISTLLSQQFDAQSQFFQTQHPDAQFAVIQKGTEDVGRFYWDDGAAQVHFLEIDIAPDWQGHGIATQVLSYARKAAHAVGRDAQLSVAKHNRARALYERLDFSVTGDTGTHWVMQSAAAR